MPMTLLCVDVRIDAPAKEIIEVAVERPPVQNAAADLIPRERREVAQIENKGVAPNDRLGEKLPFFYQAEEFIAPGPGGVESLFQICNAPPVMP